MARQKVPRAGEANSRPRWDAARRELWFHDRLVKRFPLPAANQTAILDAFETDGWPPRIDDPLPGDPAIDAMTRLHDTIKALNRNQKEICLRFRGDGSGEGVLWEPYRPKRKKNK